MYLVINCHSCGKIIMANSANRSKKCPHCGSSIPVHAARVLARSETTQEALEIIQAIKQRQGKDPSPVTFKKFKG